MDKTTIEQNRIEQDRTGQNGTQQNRTEQDRTEHSRTGQGIGACTVVRLKQLAGRSVEVLQLEVAGSFEGHAEALGVPAPLPEDVLGEAARPGAHVRKVQQLALALSRLGLLYRGNPHVVSGRFLCVGLAINGEGVEVSV